jgi:hypothetical protein
MTRRHTPNNGIPGFPSYLISSLPHCHLVGTHAKNIFLITDLPVPSYLTFLPHRLRFDSRPVYVLFLVYKVEVVEGFL